MTSLQLEMMKISGVGESTVKKLLKKFKTVANIKKATVEEIVSVGINRNTAQNIFNYYND